jgi:hypothetical protein
LIAAPSTPYETRIHRNLEKNMAEPRRLRAEREAALQQILQEAEIETAAYKTKRASRSRRHAAMFGFFKAGNCVDDSRRPAPERCGP